MRALYFDSDDSFADVLSPMFARLDSLYWIIDCQSGPVNSQWIYKSEDNERSFEAAHIDVPAFESTSTCLWRPGSLSLFRRELFFDEWSYCVGFKSDESEAIERAGRIGFPRFRNEFYEMIESEAELLAVQIDGWWEFYPANKEIFSLVQKSADCREIWPRQDSEIDVWKPRFV
jgi:hypothetical protein